MKQLLLVLAGVSLMMLSACELTTEKVRDDASGYAVQGVQKPKNQRSEDKYADNAWKKAYRELLEGYGNSEGASFFLKDLNHDEIPELFLAIDPKGDIRIYTFDTKTGMVADTGVNCGYQTSGSVIVRDLKGTDCFITGPAFSNETILYRINDGCTEQLLGFGYAKCYQFFADHYDNEISEEEFRRLFKEYTGISWNADFTEDLPEDLGLQDYLSENYADMREFYPIDKSSLYLGEEENKEAPANTEDYPEQSDAA